METVTPFKEIIDVIKEKGGDSLKYCYQCGLCDSVCPWNRVRQFSMRKVVRQGVFGLTEIEQEEIWRCSTCGTCPSRCPRGVNQIEAGVALRAMGAEYDVYPGHVATIRNVVASLTSEGNSIGGERAKRGDWAKDLPVKPYQEGMEALYFTGCYLSYDPRMRRVAQATATILNKAGVNFGILGTKESCCGESIRKTGNEELFKKLAKENIRTFIDNGVKKVIVSSPHCYHTFKNEYPEFMVNFEVVFISQFIEELIETGRLTIKGEFAKKVTYHDPCYLGRHNGVYDEPRNVLKKVPGLEFTEMADNRESALCCGGGGGRIWMETPKEERFADLRLRQAVQAGAEVLATSCPYCITNFTDSSLDLADHEKVEVKDLTEIIAEVI
ncbi:(Fe-S)-binding protein [Geomonas anaerohicana]|uniref:(Fe-S)-binding protein n=1 Tax=Geomonas anaerohicana TaxID=2798583 RepID=A0ABS0YB48_9BACT|nr:(Fe-S)-binding protein [Geomonas anaerohicana]MBJ6749529.1 (Fe-S)-binding protein [Geomonas anaerohicana]